MKKIKSFKVLTPKATPVIFSLSSSAKIKRCNYHAGAFAVKDVWKIILILNWKATG